MWLPNIKFLFSVFLFIFLISCNSNRLKRLDVDISEIDIGEFGIVRYEQDLFKINPNEIKQGLEAIQQKYLVFLAADLSDPSNLKQIKDFITDPELVQAFDEIQIKYPDLSTVTRELEEALKYYKYHFPQNPPLSVYSYISGFQYEYPVQIAKNTMIIGLDLYLGEEFPIYHKMGIPAYKAERMQEPYIAVDCMKEIAGQLIPPPPPATTFLDEILYYGKIMYFLDATLPQKEDHLKIGFRPKKLNWCIKNESNLWAFIIDNQVLFSSDFETIRRFITDGPFTAAFSNHSPARIGVWIGWQIIKSYMDNNQEVSLAELFRNTDSKYIFSESKYKPLK